MKPVIRRQRARLDIEDAVDYYVAVAGEDIAADFLDAVQAEVALIGQYPEIGSQRLGYEWGIPGLRTRFLDRFPYGLFYVDLPEHVEVWRVLHTRSDTESWIRATASD
ncbi:MAG: type II toxin-antitoxin system RelE/ParE family toxin [Propionibacteriaceae bacterium]|nr:type II toxin-antitoxin system RelE/ParE family toxin [Propionibacteriaceae bacterium]